MSKGVVFKQWYKSRNLASTPVLNQKHLLYIATKPETARNPECSFGLWGRLPGVREPENIYDLRAAKKTVGQISKEHTIWRAVFSVDKETALQHDLYNRKAWEDLLQKRIDVLAKEMGINREDFCWLAAMHYKKGHPHVHIMYWDNSDAVHQEHIPKERFEIMSEHVRAELGREIYREELQEQRIKKSGAEKAIQLELKALIKEINLSEALDLTHVSKPAQDHLTTAFAELAATVPTRGSIDYAYIAKYPEYRAKVDALTDEVLKISDFRSLLKQYEETVEEISSLYGNGEASAEFQKRKAMDALYKDCGNKIMDVIREYRKELSREAPTEQEELQALVRNTTSAMLKTSPAYQELLLQMPKHRTPIWALMKDDQDFAKAFRKLSKQICDDIRINTKLNGYIKAAGKGLDKEAKKELASATYKDALKAINGLIREQLIGDAKYEQQAQADAVTNFLIQLFREVGRSTGQRQAQRDLLKLRSRDMSKVAQRDRMTQREQGGEWEQ